MAKNNSNVATTSENENKPVVLATSSDSVSMSLKFECNSGDTRTFTFKYLKDDLTDDEVQSACEAIIDNGEAWEDAPIAIISAIATQTVKTTYLKND